MSEPNYDELGEMFRALYRAKEILGERMWEKIRMKLVEGDSAEREAECLQGLRRSAAAGYLGMSGGEYEDFLEGKGSKASKKVDDRKTLKKFLGLGKVNE